MSITKKWSKKTIALVSAASLAAAGVVGLSTPASADEISGFKLEPYSDSTSMNVMKDTTFELEFYIEGLAALNVFSDIEEISENYISVLVEEQTDAAIDVEIFEDGSSEASIDGDGGGDYVVESESSFDTDETWTIEVSTEDDEKTSAAITVFFDLNDNDEMDRGEPRSAKKTVNFLTYEDIRATTTLDVAPDQLEVDIASVITPELNYDFEESQEDIYWIYRVKHFTTNGVEWTGYDYDSTDPATYADGAWIGSFTADYEINKGDIVTVYPVYDQDADVIGPKATLAVAGVTTADIVTTELVESATARNYYGFDAGDYVEGYVQHKAKNASVVVTTRDEYGRPVAGVPVTVEVRDVYDPCSGSSCSVMTVGGKTVQNGEGGETDVTLRLKSGANGQVIVPLTSSRPEDEQYMDIYVNTPGLSEQYFYVEWYDSSEDWYIIDLNDKSDDNGGDDQRFSDDESDYRAVKDNSTYTFNLLVVDYFKQPAKYTTLDVDLDTTSGSGAVIDTMESTNGRFSVSVKDPKGDVDLDDIDFNAEMFTRENGTSIDTVSRTVDFSHYEDDDQASLYVLEATSEFNRVTAMPLVARDGATSTTNRPYFVEDAGIGRTAAEIFLDSYSVDGLQVTLSSPGLLFQTTDGDFHLGSVTVFTGNDDDSDYKYVRVYSRTSGSKTITATTAGGTQTVKVRFISEKLDELTLNTPKSVKAGKSVQLAYDGVDVNGNSAFGALGYEGALTLNNISQSGAGYLQETLVKNYQWDFDGIFNGDLISYFFGYVDGYIDEGEGDDGIYGGIWGILSTLSGDVDRGDNLSGDVRGVLDSYLEANTVTWITQAFDQGASTITVSLTSADGDDFEVSKSTWVGPVADAKAGKKKGRLVVDLYRAKGRDYKVYVGKNLVASGKSNKANYTVKVKGVKKGERKVKVVLSRGGNFNGTITIK